MPCFVGGDARYLPLCDTTFGFDATAAASASSSTTRDQPEDLSCFSDLSDRVFEYRYHVEELGRLEVACPMSVDYMRSEY